MSEGGEAEFDEAAGVAVVGPDKGQQMVRGSKLGEKHLGGGPLADVRGGGPASAMA